MEKQDHLCHCFAAGHCRWHQAVPDNQQYIACREGTPPEPADPVPCIYLGQQTSIKRRRVDQPIYQCGLYSECTLKKNKAAVSACEGCHSYLPTNAEDQKIRDHWVDQLKITDREGKETKALRNMLKGNPAFLVCGGPSLKRLEYQRLAERGVFSLAVNNVAAWAPVTAFVCSDPPSKFHDGIFLDPKIMKFLPTPKLIGRRGTLRHKTPNGDYVDREESTRDCPNVWGFERRSWMACDDTWFTAPGAAWGNHKQGVEKFGCEKNTNTMLLGLRLLQYLGARTIFLLGVDFHMSPHVGLHENYAFGEQRDADAINTCNNNYRVTSKWLAELKPVFDRFGFSVYNCNPHSQLRAFDYVPFDLAMKLAKRRMPAEPWDLSNWYLKGDKLKESKAS